MQLPLFSSWKKIPFKPASVNHEIKNVPDDSDQDDNAYVLLLVQKGRVPNQNRVPIIMSTLCVLKAMLFVKTRTEGMRVNNKPV